MQAQSRVASCWIPGKLWCLNEIIALRASKYRGAYSRQKSAHSAHIATCIVALGKWGAAHVSLELVEPNRRRDPDGISSGAAKVVLDTLVEEGVLPNDGWQNVLSLSYSWRVDRDNPGVLLTLSEEK